MKNLITLLIVLFAYVMLSAQSSVAYLNVPEFTENKAKFTADNNSSRSFELVGGMIFIQANVNGKTGDFILDTGAPGVILNHKPKPESKNYIAGGLSGGVAVGEVKIEEFQWGIINLSNLNGYTLDISHLEKSFDKDIAGLIGFDVFSDYELLFDYQNQLVQILPARKNELHKNAKPKESISFSKNGHLPVITAKIGGKSYRFGLDTGAEINLMDAPLFAFLQNTMKILPDEKVQGLDKNKLTVKAGLISETAVRSTHFEDLKFLFVDLSAVNASSDVKIDGLLGFSFFERGKVSINFKKGKIYFW